MLIMGIVMVVLWLAFSEPPKRVKPKKEKNSEIIKPSNHTR